MKRILSVFALSLLALSSSQGALLEVPTQYSTIQSAVNATAVSDTVYVHPGIYLERLIMPPHDFLLVSQYFFSRDSVDIDSTIIDARDYAESDTGAVLNFPGGNTRATLVSGFTLTGGHCTSLEYVGGGGGAVFCFRAHPTIASCYLRGNDCGWGCAVALYESYALISHCRITDNCGGIGVLGVVSNLYLQQTAVIEWTEFARNYGCSDFGDILSIQGVLAHMSEVDIRYCYFHDYVAYDCAAIFLYASQGEFEGNLFERITEHPEAQDIVFFMTNQRDCVVRRNIFRNLTGLGHGSHCLGLWYADQGLGGAVVEQNWFENIENTEGPAAVFALMGEYIIIRNNDFINCRGGDGALSLLYHSQQPGCRTVVEGNRFFGNRFAHPRQSNSAIFAYGSVAPCTLRNNWFEGNEGNTVWLDPAGSDWEWDASYNYWGDSTGPYHEIENPNGRGDTVRSDVHVTPWLTAPPEITPAEERYRLQPDDWSLEVPFPNPFNEQTRLVLRSKKSQPFEVTAYNTLGQQVARVWQGVVPPEGASEIVWNARHPGGSPLANGVYYLVARPMSDRKASHKVVKALLLK